MSWWEAVKGEAAPSSWNKYKVEVARGIQAADIVVAPSLAMLAALNRHYGEIRDGRVIPNGRDINSFCTRAKKDFLLSAGRLWDEAKNVAALNFIASKLNWDIYIAGDINIRITNRTEAEKTEGEK